MTEADLLEEVRKLAKLYHFAFYHTHTSMHSAKGFPDLVLLSLEQRRIIYAELKGPTRMVTPEQQDWINGLQACGQEAYVWRPADIEQIATVLRGD